MPVDFEMLLSASPPLFSPSALADFHYAYNHRNMPTQHHHNNSQHNNNSSLFRLNALNGKGSNTTTSNVVTTTPIRPILIIKTLNSPDNEEMPDLESPTSPSGRDKKKVWFADDRGLALTHVRIMGEPSNCPPRWTDSFLEHVTRGAITCGGLNSRRRRPGAGNNGGLTGNGLAKWRIVFPQPASDYVPFRQKLEKECVSLENVIVREDGESPSPLVTGTIKVKNLAFNKEVLVRFSFDRWLGHQDVKCTFVPSGLDSGATPQYDTFSFTETIPATADKYQTVEFCICFKCDGKEYWDSHNGTNYKIVLVKEAEIMPPKPVNDPLTGRPAVIQPKFVDPVKADFDRWTEFASWNHLYNDSPYW